MGKKDFSGLTEPQRMRDEAVIGQIQALFVNPLLDELDSCIAGYRDMSDHDKYLSLLKLNEEHAPEGDWLIVDFGIIDGYKPTSTAFFAGEHLYMRRDFDGVMQYLPLYVDSDFPGLPKTPDALILNNLTLFDEQGLESYFNRLPVSFKVAAVARTIQQNLLVSRASACRFAAGFDNELSVQRWRIGALESGQIQRFGWHIDIRDTSPENELVIELARRMRSAVKTGMDSYGYIPADEKLPYYAEADVPRQRKRTRHKSTDMLVEFIDVVLPSRGCHVGRNGTGKRISWYQAYLMFNDEHPGYYCSEKSFRDSYCNAKKTREQMPSTPSGVQDRCDVMENDF